MTGWNHLEPTRGQLRFPKWAQQAFASQSARGIAFLGSLSGAPDWAAEREFAWVAPSARLPGNLDAYERYVRAVVKHYRGKISHWEIGNEPAPAYAKPERYGEVVRRAVRVIREVAPEATIISMAGIDNDGVDGPEFIDKAIAAGATDGVDGISFHYADSSMCNYIAGSLDFYRLWRNWARRGQDRPLQLWDTEEHARAKPYITNTAMGVRRTFQYIGVHLFEFWVGSLTPEATAYYVAGHLLQTMSGGGLYQLHDDVVGALAHDDNTSILAIWSEKFTGTTSAKYYHDPFFAPLGGATMSTDDFKRVPVWLRDVHSVKVPLPAGVDVRDHMGAPLPAEDGPVTVGADPVYLIVSRRREAELLRGLGAQLAVPPNE